jgi:hypothetical protein
MWDLHSILGARFLGQAMGTSESQPAGEWDMARRSHTVSAGNGGVQIVRRVS